MSPVTRYMPAIDIAVQDPPAPAPGELQQAQIETDQADPEESVLDIDTMHYLVSQFLEDSEHKKNSVINAMHDNVQRLAELIMAVHALKYDQLVARVKDKMAQLDTLRTRGLEKQQRTLAYKQKMHELFADFE